MCVYPATVAKVSVLISIPVTTAMQITEIVFAIINLVAFTGPATILYLCLTVGFLLLVGLGVGFYGTIVKNVAFMRAMLFLIAVNCLVKAYIWIICVNKRNNYDKIVTNLWFQIGLACSVVCFVAAVIYCLRLRDFVHN